MNERIKILWETANNRFTNDYQLSGKPREECRSVPDIFAELIVRECIDKIETYQIPCGTSAAEMACEWTYDALKSIRDDIKETFGVE